MVSIKTIKIVFKLSLMALTLNGCAIVHHVQVGDIDDRENSERFEVLISETAFNLPQAARLAAALSRSQSRRKNYGRLGDYIKLFQMGPTTGPGVFNEKYAEQLLTLILRACPEGKISGLTSIREMRKYPIVSGQVVKFTGYCQKS